jgi:DNA-binding response OmpR family regulator
LTNPQQLLTPGRQPGSGKEVLVWGDQNYPNTRTIDTHLVNLRHKLEPIPEAPRFFVTVHGIGYKFVD